MRIHELAKELGVSSKVLLSKLHDLGVEAGSHMSALDETAVELMRDEYGKAVPEVREDTAKTTDDRKGKKEAPKTEHKVREAKPRLEAGVQPPKSSKVIKVRGPIVVRDFAEKLGVRPNQLIAELMGMNVLASISERVEINIAKMIAEKHGFLLEHEKKIAEHQYIHRKHEIEETKEEKDEPEDLVTRAPVVTFLGHVDHGKTSLLDKIRNTAVAKGEHGGITQHIGAYTVDISGRNITFLDTPGHEAFTAMRARGANLTDIAVIVIAADDGVMPQTNEAIMHARAAGVSILVAINKMDLPTANSDRVKKQLQALDLTPEDWGGAIICCPVSAQTGEGINHLLEMILLQSEILELKANPKRCARGYVIEAQLEAGMGPTANLLVTNGTLNIGATILCGRYCGRVRALINDHGVKIKSAPPSTPVKCLGLSGVPEAGATFRVCSSDRVARSLSEEAMAKLKDKQVSIPKRASLNDIYDQLKKSEILELKVIIKADTQGSVEAIIHSLNEIKSSKILLNIILSGTGNITENDVMLASASNAVILGFNVAKEPRVDAMSKHEGVEIRLHSVIYELIDQVRDAMTGLLTPQIEEKLIGRAEVRQVFSVGKTSKVAGCLVIEGSVTPRFRARVKRGDEVLFEGSIASLRHFKDDAAEVKESQECGIRLENFTDFGEGDILEFYELHEIKQTL